MRLRPRRPARLLPLLAVATALVPAALADGSGARSDTAAVTRSDRVAFGPAGPVQAPGQWCGGDRTSANRPDLLAGNQVRVVYAVPADGVDGFGALVHRIVADIGAIDAWWRRQDPAKAPRFDLAPFAGCASAAGQADIAFLRLASSSSTLATFAGRIAAFSVELPRAGLMSSTKKLLIYYDGPVAADEQDICGTAPTSPPFNYYAGIWVQACDRDVGSGDFMAAVAAHELLHSLGAQPDGAPHECAAPNDGHPCDSALDLMYPILSDHFANLVLDVGRDDYYGHSGAWPDMQDSPWLMRADVPPSTLTVTVQQRSRTDSVSSAPAGIACPAACSILFDTGLQVQLTPTPGSGSRLVSWTGACTGRGACTVPMDAAKTVGAVFGPSTFALTLTATGRGRIGAAAVALSCTRRCSKAVAADTAVRVRATPSRGWRFLRWSGACGGRGPCTVRLSQNRAVGAVFRRT